MILQDQNRRVVSEGVQCFSSDQFAQMWSKCSTSNHTALGYVDCVLVNAHLAGPFVIKNFSSSSQFSVLPSI